MYRLTERPAKTTINRSTAYVGETIENKIMRIINNKEPISDSAKLIYTERKEGVLPDYDIRTDRMEHALDAMTVVSKTHRAKRDNKPTVGEQAKDGMKKEGETPVNTNATN